MKQWNSKLSQLLRLVLSVLWMLEQLFWLQLTPLNPSTIPLCLLLTTFAYHLLWCLVSILSTWSLTVKTIPKIVDWLIISYLYTPKPTVLRTKKISKETNLAKTKSPRNSSLNTSHMLVSKSSLSSPSPLSPFSLKNTLKWEAWATQRRLSLLPQDSSNHWLDCLNPSLKWDLVRSLRPVMYKKLSDLSLQLCNRSQLTLKPVKLIWISSTLVLPKLM